VISQVAVDIVVVEDEEKEKRRHLSHDNNNTTTTVTASTTATMTATTGSNSNSNSSNEEGEENKWGQTRPFRLNRRQRQRMLGDNCPIHPAEREQGGSEKYSRVSGLKRYSNLPKVVARG
jgi:hypothetical protein